MDNNNNAGFTPEPVKESKWKLALFAKPRRPEDLPIRRFEIFALCFCIVQTPIMLLAMLWTVMAGAMGVVFAFCARGNAENWPLALAVIGGVMFVVALLVALECWMISLSIRFLYRRKKALYGMIVCTVIMLMGLVFAAPILLESPFDPEAFRFNMFHWCALALISLQYLPSIVVGWKMFRRFR